MDYSALVAQTRDAAPIPQFDNALPCSWLTAHIDGDYLAYYAAGNAETSPGLARQSVLHRVDKVKRLTGACSVVMHLTADHSTKGDRFLAAKTKKYQGQRGGSKPVNWRFLRDYMEAHDGSKFTPKLWTNREADDGIAYLTHTLAEQRGQLHVIHTADKDMRMFAGVHLNWKTWHKTVVPLGAYDVLGQDGLQYGHRWFWMQMLKGDTADNIPGLPRVGDVAADNILRGTTCNGEASEAVCKAYRSRMGEGWEAYLVEQAMLLWMRVDRAATSLDFLRLGCFPLNVQEAAWHAADRIEQELQYLDSLKR